MLLLLTFAFISGIVTILSPCILPILPIILASSYNQSQDNSRPYGIIIGFVASFTFFTLFLSSIVQYLNISSDTLRNLAVIVIAIFGATLLIPRLQLLLESLFARLSGLVPTTTNRPGMLGGILIGLSLGLLWTPCVGPILASVITLALSGSVTFDAFLVTIAYSLGTAIPMFLIIKGGTNTFARNKNLLKNSAKIQRLFGVIMIIMALLIYRGIDRQFQVFILTSIPNYSEWLTSIEDNNFVNDTINSLR